MAKYFCLYCGWQAGSVSALTSGTCPRSPNSGGHHVLYDGSEKSQYTCKYCGLQSGAISGLTSGTCPRSPNSGGHHVPAL